MSVREYVNIKWLNGWLRKKAKTIYLTVNQAFSASTTNGTGFFIFIHKIETRFRFQADAVCRWHYGFCLNHQKKEKKKRKKRTRLSRT